MASLKAIRIEKTKEVFRFEIDFAGQDDPPVEQANGTALVNSALSFMEARACVDEDLTDGVELAGELHDTIEELPQRDDTAYQIGRDYAKLGDELFKDPVKREQLIAILEPFVSGPLAKGGSLLKTVLMTILCDKLGLVSEIRLERIASLFMLLWNLFKTAVITYSIVKGFEILVKILKYVILFLQETHFFDKLKELGGWNKLCQLIASYKSSQLLAIPTSHLMVAMVAGVTGGVIVYCYMKWRN